MYKKVWVLFAIGFVALQGSMCNNEENIKGTPVEKIDGITIYREDIDANVSKGVQMTPQMKDSMLKTLEKMVLLYLAARDEGFTKDPDIMRKAIWAKRIAIINDYVYRKTAGLTVSDAEVNKFIEDRKALFGKNVSFDVLYVYDTTKMKEFIKLFKFNSRSRKLLNYQKLGLVRVESHDDNNLGLWALNFGENNPMTQVLLNVPVKGISEPINLGNFYIVYKKTAETSQDLNAPEIKEYIRQYVLSSKKQEVINNIYKMYIGKYKPEAMGK